MNETTTMNAMMPQPTTEAHRVQANRDELVERIARAIHKDGRTELLKGLMLHRESSPAECAQHSISSIAFCVIAQGSKDVFLGDDRYQYDPMHYLLATAELPVISNITEATPEQPFLSLCIKLDPVLFNSVMVKAKYTSSRKHFNQPLRIDDITQELGMSTSSFHYHFKAVTALSPLQFQKQIRLQEARRLMLGEGLDATSAGFRVGYNDASHFNREYKRLFGMPPLRDVERLRESTGASAN